MAPHTGVRSLFLMLHEVIVLAVMNKKVDMPFLVLEHVASHLSGTL
jgi:hypothetical protein